MLGHLAALVADQGLAQCALHIAQGTDPNARANAFRTVVACLSGVRTSTSLRLTGSSIVPTWLCCFIRWSDRLPNAPAADASPPADCAHESIPRQRCEPGQAYALWLDVGDASRAPDASLRPPTVLSTGARQDVDGVMDCHDEKSQFASFGESCFSRQAIALGDHPVSNCVRTWSLNKHVPASAAKSSLRLRPPRRLAMTACCGAQYPRQSSSTPALSAELDNVISHG